MNWVRVQLFWQHHPSFSKRSANAVAVSRLHESTDSLHSGSAAPGLGMNSAVLQTLGCFPAWKHNPSMYLQRRDCTTQAEQGVQAAVLETSYMQLVS